MSTTFQVTTTQLRAKANELRASNRDLNMKVEQLKMSKRSLDSMWDGDANNEFNTHFDRDIAQMMDFYNEINRYIEKLEAIACEYENAERTAVNIAKF